MLRRASGGSKSFPGISRKRPIDGGNCADVRREDGWVNAGNDAGKRVDESNTVVIK